MTRTDIRLPRPMNDQRICGTGDSRESRTRPVYCLLQTGQTADYPSQPIRVGCECPDRSRRSDRSLRLHRGGRLAQWRQRPGVDRQTLTDGTLLTRSADLYDVIYGQRFNAAAAAETVHALVQSHTRGAARTLLEVAC